MRAGYKISSKAYAVARLLACHDPRLETEKIAGELGYSRDAVEDALRQLRSNAAALWPQHIRDIRVLGLQTLVVEAAPLPATPMSIEDLEKYGVPLARYMYSYRVVLRESQVGVYSYIVPLSLRDRIIEEVVNGLPRVRSYDIGWIAPIKAACSPSAPPSLEEEVRRALSLEAEYERLLGKFTVMKDYDIVDLLIYASLDLKPLATRSELLDITWPLQERLGEQAITRKYKMNRRKALAKYELLSRKGLLGRVLLHKIFWPGEDIIPLYLVVDASCAPRLYALASRLFLAANIFVGERTAATIVTVPDPLLEELRVALKNCNMSTGVITSGVGTVLPFDMYHPSVGWRLEPFPVSVLEILRGRGIISG